MRGFASVPEAICVVTLAVGNYAVVFPDLADSLHNERSGCLLICFRLTMPL